MEMSCTAGGGDVLYSRRRRCLVWPETEISRMAGDGDVSYGWRWLLTLVRADGIQPYWYVHIYTGLVALLDRIQTSFSIITISTIDLLSPSSISTIYRESFLKFEKLLLSLHMWCDAAPKISHFRVAAAAAERLQMVSQKGSHSLEIARPAVAVAFFTVHHSLIRCYEMQLTLAFPMRLDRKHVHLSLPIFPPSWVHVSLLHAFVVWLSLLYFVYLLL